MAWPIPDVPADEQRTVRFKPAFHRCHPEPSKDYGIGSVTMLWMLRVGDWAITWEVFTDWGLPDEAFKAAVPDCDHPMHRNGYPRYKADGGVVAWHMPVPLFEEHEPSDGRCPLIERDECYGDMDYTLASEVFDVLRTDGDEAAWCKLRELLDDRRSEVASTVGSEAPGGATGSADPPGATSTETEQ